MLTTDIPLDDVSSLEMLEVSTLTTKVLLSSRYTVKVEPWCRDNQEIAESVDIDETLGFVRDHFTSFRDADEMDWNIAHTADTDGSGDLDLQYARTT